MERAAELTQSTLDVLIRNYIVLIALLVIVLVFAFYVYLFPRSIDFFENPPADSTNAAKKETPQ